MMLTGLNAVLVQVTDAPAAMGPVLWELQTLGPEYVGGQHLLYCPHAAPLVEAGQRLHAFVRSIKHLLLHLEEHYAHTRETPLTDLVQDMLDNSVLLMKDRDLVRAALCRTNRLRVHLPAQGIYVVMELLRNGAFISEQLFSKLSYINVAFGCLPVIIQRLHRTSLGKSNRETYLLMSAFDDVLQKVNC